MVRERFEGINYYGDIVLDNPNVAGWTQAISKVYSWVSSGRGLDVGSGNITISPETFRADMCEYPGLDFLCDAAHLVDRAGNPLPDRFVEWVFSSHCLEHTLNPLDVLIEWCRVAQKFVIVLVPNGKAWDDLPFEESKKQLAECGHFQNFHLNDLIELVRQIPGVDLEECGYDSIGRGSIYVVIRKNDWSNG